MWKIVNAEVTVDAKVAKIRKCKDAGVNIYIYIISAKAVRDARDARATKDAGAAGGARGAEGAKAARNRAAGGAKVTWGTKGACRKMQVQKV